MSTRSGFIRALHGQFSDNIAIKRTPQEKAKLIADILVSLESTKSKPLREQMMSRIRQLRTEIRETAVASAQRAAEKGVEDAANARKPRRIRSPILSAGPSAAKVWG